MRPLGTRPSTLRSQSLSLSRGSWISLFAMLMIFIGPLISQSMPMNSRASMTMSMSMDMSMDMPGMDHAGHSAQADPEHCPPAHHALWEKCGYCSLLFNCPALTAGLTNTTFSIPPANTFTILSPRLGHARQPFFPGARTRAPPIVV
jgi:hypothetical protein